MMRSGGASRVELGCWPAQVELAGRAWAESLAPQPAQPTTRAPAPAGARPAASSAPRAGCGQWPAGWGGAGWGCECCEGGRGTTQGHAGGCAWPASRERHAGCLASAWIKHASQPRHVVPCRQQAAVAQRGPASHLGHGQAVLAQGLHEGELLEGGQAGEVEPGKVVALAQVVALALDRPAGRTQAGGWGCVCVRA